LTKSSHVNPSTFDQRRETRPIVERVQSIVSSSCQQSGLLNETLIHRLMDSTRSSQVLVMICQLCLIRNFDCLVSRPLTDDQPSTLISWSNWNESKSDDDNDNDDNENNNNTTTTNVSSAQHSLTTNKQMHDWHSLIQSTISLQPTDHCPKQSEIMPKFDFDDHSFENLFENFDQE
jgi:hypothetical protein